MTSYLRNLLGLHTQTDETDPEHKYHKTALNPPSSVKKPMNPSIATDLPHSRKANYKKAYLSQPTVINNRTGNTALRDMQSIECQANSESELEDIDLPPATLEQQSLIATATNSDHLHPHHLTNSTLHHHHQPHHIHSSTLSTKRSSARHPWANKELSWWNHFCIGAYWFGWAFLWMPLLVIVIPHQIEYIVEGVDSGKSMGSVFLIGSVGSIVCSPVFGHLSDTSQNAMGRRRPFLMVGICITTMGLLLMSVSPPYHIYCVGFFVCSCGNFITLAPYSALVPDVVPFDQRGICSGWLGACSMFGYLLGGAMSYHLEKLGFFLTFIFLAMVHALFGWITLRFVPEIHNKSAPYTAMETNDLESEDMIDGVEDVTEIIDEDVELSLEESHGVALEHKSHELYPNRQHFGFFESSPFWSQDFVWLFVSRFFIQMGAIIVQENLQYYLRDTKGGDFTLLGILLAKDEVQAVAVLFAPLLCGALISSIVSGIVSDIYGQQRKFLVYVSGTLMSVCCILFGFNRWFAFDIILSLFFGFGFGIFSAIDWAMATDVLPNANSYGRDMGFWNLSMTLPQVIGSPIVGYLIDIFRKLNYVHLGWLAIFLFSACNFVIGTSLVKKIAHVK
eukprot:CAMPEP_0197035750 /NCGR_PEP_ID=MMETSP1384-20130603/13456_1 /TAXON_ID=29189 /ORGANISM="Ammonia sp." /LENGTH=619 /DNA_ID=CAMNT_0042465847 /DNA_START=63 /DNA_END=1922 /DNA_ORIENTATION=+